MRPHGRGLDWICHVRWTSLITQTGRGAVSASERSLMSQNKEINGPACHSRRNSQRAFARRDGTRKNSCKSKRIEYGARPEGRCAILALDYCNLCTRVLHFLRHKKGD